MICQCRNCYKEYENYKSKAMWAGFCSAKCQHAKAKELRFESKDSEYEILNRRHCLGDVPIEIERVELEKELENLDSSKYASRLRIKVIKRLLSTELKKR